MRSSIGEQIQQLMHVSMCTPVDSGRDNGPLFLDIRVCHQNADSYKQIYKLHEDEKKRKYASRITEVENGTLTPLVFTTPGGMSQECQRYHSRLAELISS